MLQGEAHSKFVALSVEWAENYNRGKASRSKEEREACRKRIAAINREQRELLERNKPL